MASLVSALANQIRMSRERTEDVPFVVELRDGGPGVKVRR
jgi:hypothetical protein